MNCPHSHVGDDDSCRVHNLVILSRSSNVHGCVCLVSLMDRMLTSRCARTAANDIVVARLAEARLAVVLVLFSFSASWKIDLFTINTPFLIDADLAYR